MRLSLQKSNNNASLPSSKKGIITLIHIDEIIAMPKTDYQGIRCLNEIQLKENPQLQYLYLTPFTQKEEITPSGDIESTLFSTKISGTFPGNKIEAAEFLKQNINEPFVIIYEDFTENTKFIYGSKYHPLFIKSEYKSDSTGKLWNFTLEQSHASDVPYLYYVGPQLGGRNLALNSKGFIDSNADWVRNFNLSENLIIGKQYTITVRVRAIQGGDNYFGINDVYGNNSFPIIRKSYNVFSFTFIANHDSNELVLTRNPLGSARYYQFENFKIEKGTESTLWTPAPEDIIM